jgi:hypothetical protein
MAVTIRPVHLDVIRAGVAPIAEIGWINIGSWLHLPINSPGPALQRKADHSCGHICFQLLTVNGEPVDRGKKHVDKEGNNAKK